MNQLSTSPNEANISLIMNSRILLFFFVMSIRIPELPIYNERSFLSFILITSRIP
jgi:hypothetical protein